MHELTDLMRTEVEMLHEVDRPGSNIDTYVSFNFDDSYYATHQCALCDHKLECVCRTGGENARLCGAEIAVDDELEGQDGKVSGYFEGRSTTAGGYGATFEMRA